MKEISLTQDKVALVDDIDYDWLSQWKWCAVKMNKGNFYAVRSSPMKNGKHYSIPMAREILGLEYGDKRQADHSNHNTLDNCRANIRICTSQQNNFNRNISPKQTSKFKGVYWDKRDKKWIARIYINRRRKILGYWDMEEVAALAYDMVAIREFGEFACLNFN